LSTRGESIAGTPAKSGWTERNPIAVRPHTMLSRTAESLYWLARYTERAENLARILDVTLRMAGLLPRGEGASSEWHSTIVAAGCADGFYAKHEEATADAVIHYITCDPDNPSSILCCIEIARRNSRAVRTALTTDMWEAVNGTWLEARALQSNAFTTESVHRFLDWVKERSRQFDGAVVGTMLRNDACWFTRLGTFVERADNTARLLDVKYHVLLPDYESVGGAVDYHQWAAILRSMSALRSYHWVYRDRIKPWLIAELLILRPETPRSLINCLSEIMLHLDLLAQSYGRRNECHRLAGQMHARLRYERIDQIFQSGLHEFLTEFINANIELGNEISRQYLS
jgi:uncharacterized alpha-E superfamily protein